MLLAYIDEIGEPGAFVSKEHQRFNTSPAFGYAGFVLPDCNARAFGAKFVADKRALYAHQIAETENIATWEKKGAELFRPRTPQRAPHELRVFNALVKHVRDLGGQLFYFAEEKPLGTPKQTGLDLEERRMTAMRETANRVARHAKREDDYVLLLMDAVQEHERKHYVQRMYAHILGRA